MILTGLDCSRWLRPLGQPCRPFPALLEVPTEDPTWQALDPAQRRQCTLDALEMPAPWESQVQPLLLVFENLHWIEAETQVFLDGLVESLPAARMLLLVNYRPEYQYGWGQKTYYTQLRLDPLPPASAEALLQSLLGDDPGSRATQTALDRAHPGESVLPGGEHMHLGGNAGAGRRARSLSHGHGASQYPGACHGAGGAGGAHLYCLAPEEKQLLQTVAVIGTEVPLALLHAMVEAPEEALRLGLTRLQAAEFFYETCLFPEVEYTFKHGLTQQAGPDPDAASGTAASAPCPHR